MPVHRVAGGLQALRGGQRQPVGFKRLAFGGQLRLPGGQLRGIARGRGLLYAHIFSRTRN